MRGLITGVPVTRRVVDRFVAGENLDQASAVLADLVGEGLTATVDRLGEDTLDASDAAATRDAYLAMLKRFAELGIAGRTEVSVKLSALGQKLPKDAAKITLENAVAIAEAARDAGTTMTLDMEDHTTVDATLGTLRDLRGEFPWVGVAIQAMLFRTEGDITDLATAGSRVRLVKGAYMEPASVAHQDKHEVDKAYVRAMGTLMRSSAYPMIGSHDQRMIDIAHKLVGETGREPDTYEFQMLHGIRATEQRALVAGGETVRVYVPFGDDWYGYFMRRLAERPANVMFFLNSLVKK
ncbi:proline dehydrogenase family protein [Catenulispora yoronensis]|uniref:proline dehydrogenase n=2 Tax=Catenulispora yoronensis TaxID=450799 RepID=A0ABN2VBP7_9ACTN